MQEWNGFKGTKWQQVIDVEDFILNNYQEYKGSSDFLKGISKKTTRLTSRISKLLTKEDITGLLDVETSSLTSIDAFEPGYIDKKNEIILGLQTDDPLKQAVNPLTLDTSIDVLKNNGYRFERSVIDNYHAFNDTYEENLDEVTTKEIKKFKEVHLLDGMPDNYGRGFMLGDYRRLPLYGIDYLIARKEHDLNRLRKDINYSVIRTRDEVVKQIKALKQIKILALSYGVDISRPASNAKEAFQWLYFAYLAVSKETCGAAIPVGNNSAFLDIYLARDLELGIITEDEAQELVDQFILKLRLIRCVRNADFKMMLMGRNTLVTETIGGVHKEHSLITKTAYRFLNTIETLGLYPSPSFTILWSTKMPNNFKRYLAKVMMKHNCLCFANADALGSSNYATNGLASSSKIGKQIDYNGGSCNLAKILLYAINGGRDELTGELIIDGVAPLDDATLTYSKVVRNFAVVLKKLVTIYADNLNTIHYMHDKYGYESSLMAFNDTVVERYMTFNISGFATLVDSLSAIRFAKVKVNRDENGLSTDFVVTGDYPHYGCGLDAVDKLASDIIRLISRELAAHHMYRNAVIKLGLQSVGMSVLYGMNTGTTPDGRFRGSAYSFNADPGEIKNTNGLLNALKSVMRMPSKLCSGGIMTTINVNALTLGSKRTERAENLIGLLDSYFKQNGSVVAINIIDKKQLPTNDKADDLILNVGGIVTRHSDLPENIKATLFDLTYYDKL